MCRAYQLPHSGFLAWSKDDRDKALWEYVRSRERCPGCHTRREEWLESEGGHRKAYAAELDRCPGCEALEYKREEITEKSGKGVHVRLVRRR